MEEVIQRIHKTERMHQWRYKRPPRRWIFLAYRARKMAEKQVGDDGIKKDDPRYIEEVAYTAFIEWERSVQKESEMRMDDEFDPGSLRVIRIPGQYILLWPMEIIRGVKRDPSPMFQGEVTSPKQTVVKKRKNIL